MSAADLANLKPCPFCAGHKLFLADDSRETANGALTSSLIFPHS